MIKKILSEIEIDNLEKLIEQAEKDKRLGVKRLAAVYRRKLNKEKSLADLAELMFQHERELHLQGHRFIAGVDEVGRGCLAGPIVAAAVIFPQEILISGLKDSKLLTAALRQRLDKKIKSIALDWKIALIDNNGIDRLGLQQANLLVLNQAVNKLNPKPDFVLVDGFSLPSCVVPHKRLVKGDRLSLSIAAASIIAKVYRDLLMEDLSKTYSDYGFESNKGYGTKAHLDAIAKYGMSPLHRASFRPVSLCGQQQLALAGEIKSAKN